MIRVRMRSHRTSQNPFLTYIDDHPTADARALKELFRILAKRTHPDTGGADQAAFVRLQACYHEALAWLESEPQETGKPEPREPSQEAPDPPRVGMLRALYRYKALMPTMEIDARVPERAVGALDEAIVAAARYRGDARGALESFRHEFHERRAEVARYPDIRVKYRCLMKGLVSFFDYEWMPNDYNLRLSRSYLDEIHPVTDYDPALSPDLRTNRSAAPRSALYRVRSVLDHELSLPVADLI